MSHLLNLSKNLNVKTASYGRLRADNQLRWTIGLPDEVTQPCDCTTLHVKPQIVLFCIQITQTSYGVLFNDI